VRLLAASVVLGTFLAACSSGGVGGKGSSYPWIRSGKKAPPATDATIAIESPRSSTVELPDEDAMITIPKGSIPPHGEDHGVRVVLRPLDRASVGPLPRGWKADGNAYKVEIKYVPSRTLVTLQQTSFDKIAKLLLEMARDLDPAITEADPSSPGANRYLLFSPDGTDWKRVDAAFTTLDPHPRGFHVTSLKHFGIYIPAIRQSKGAPDPPRLE
jgi:hypothetical protein